MESLDTVLLVGLFVAALAAGQAAAWAGGARKAHRTEATFRWDGRPPASSIPALNEFLGRIPGMKGLQRLQAQAGHEGTGASVVAASLALAVVAEVAAIAAFGEPIPGLLAALPASAAPLGLLYAARARRGARIQEELPAAMRALYRLSGAGHAASAIVADAARSLDGPLGVELRRAFEEQRRGRPLHDALRAMTDRVPGCMDLRLLVTTIVLAEESGGDLGEAVARLEGTVSRRIALALELRAETARARMSAGVIAGMPFVGLLGIWGLQPEWIQAGWEDPAGRVLQQGATVLIALGVALVARLLRRPR